ncbi:MAG: type I restriction endonuclease, partial [Phototrophicaceae bacterium]
MTTINPPERVTQNRVVRHFQDVLGYDYLGNWQDRPNNRNVEVGLLQTFLRARYDDATIQRAIDEFQRVAGNQADALYEVNKQVYGLLRYGVKVKPNPTDNYVTVWLIDWNHPEANHFAIAEEVTVRGQNTKRPDIVIYVNGIALGVLELKRSTVFVSEGIRQNLGNQQDMFIKRFFTTMQLVMAGNDTQGLRYGTTLTPEKYHLTWKEEGAPPPDGYAMDADLTHLCSKTRLLQLIHDFIIFDH